MRTRREEMLDVYSQVSTGTDDIIAEFRAMAGEALRHPTRAGSGQRLLRAAVVLPLLGISATMADAMHDLVRRSRIPELDEPADS